MLIGATSLDAYRMRYCSSDNAQYHERCLIIIRAAVIVFTVVANLLYSYALYMTKVTVRMTNLDCLFLAQSLLDIIACSSYFVLESIIGKLSQEGCLFLPPGWDIKSWVSFNKVTQTFLIVAAASVSMP